MGLEQWDRAMKVEVTSNGTKVNGQMSNIVSEITKSTTMVSWLSKEFEQWNVDRGETCVVGVIVVLGV